MPTCTGTPAQTQQTAADGSYLFTGLTDGDYCVKVVDGTGTPLEDYTLTGDPDGGTLSNQWPITGLSGDTEDLDNNFGYLPGGDGAINGTVFEDLRPHILWMQRPAFFIDVQSIRIDPNFYHLGT